MKKTLVFIILMVFLFSASTKAQVIKNKEEGEYISSIYLGLGVGGNWLLKGSSLKPGENTQGSVSMTSIGVSWDLFIGVRFLPYLALEAGWVGMYHPSQEAGTLDYAVLEGVRGGGRIYIPTGLILEPFVKFGVGFYGYGDEWEFDIFGFGFDLGPGISLEVTTNFGLELFVNYNGWYFGGGGECNSGGCPTTDYVHSVNFVLNFLFVWPIFFTN